MFAALCVSMRNKIPGILEGSSFGLKMKYEKAIGTMLCKMAPRWKRHLFVGFQSLAFNGRRFLAGFEQLIQTIECLIDGLMNSRGRFDLIECCSQLNWFNYLASFIAVAVLIWALLLSSVSLLFIFKNHKESIERNKRRAQLERWIKNSDRQW